MTADYIPSLGRKELVVTSWLPVCLTLLGYARGVIPQGFYLQRTKLESGTITVERKQKQTQIWKTKLWKGDSF